MQVFIPRHISGGMFNMNLQIGPISVSIIQLVILAMGVASSLGIWNGLTGAGMGTVPAIILASPALIIFLVIAFFKFSELTLLPFIEKMLRTYFFDNPVKYQVNYNKVDNVQVAIKKLRNSESKAEPDIKTKNIDRKQLDRLSSILDE